MTCLTMKVNIIGRLVSHDNVCSLCMLRLILISGYVYIKSEEAISTASVSSLLMNLVLHYFYQSPFLWQVGITLFAFCVYETLKNNASVVIVSPFPP